MQPYRNSQRRAAFGARVALACTCCASFLFAELPAGARSWLPTSLVVFVPVVCFLTSTSSLGDTVKLTLTFGFTEPLLMAFTVGVAYLGYLIGGCAWHPSIMRTLMPISTFLLIIWTHVAAVRQAPRAQLVGDPAVVFMSPLLLALLAEGDVEQRSPLKIAASLTSVVVLGAIASYIFAHLPFRLGAAAGRQTVPLLAANKLYAVADYYEALALRWDDVPMSISRRSSCRHQALKATAALRGACASAEFECAQASPAEREAAEQMRRHAESCRMALMLSHAASLQGFSDITQEILYHGRAGEARIKLAVAASRALRAAASVSARIAGQEPDLAAFAEQEPGEGQADVVECRKAAEDCAEALRRFQSNWTRDTRNLLHHQLQSIANSEDEQERLAQAFLRGDLHNMQDVAVAGSTTDRRTEAFAEICRALASHLSACSAAEAAAAAAEAAATFAEEAERASCGFAEAFVPVPGGLGLLTWLTAPCSGLSVWREALKNGSRHAWRLSFGVVVATLLTMHARSVLSSGTWVIVTVGICVTPVQGAAIVKAVRRLGGTLLGALFSLASMMISPGDRLVLWSHTLIVVFILKFFERELQYASAVSFVTYMIIIAAVLDGHDGSRAEVLRVTGQRVMEVAVGVILSTLVSIFVAPDHAVDALRSQELKALRLAGSSVTAASRTLAGIASAESSHAERAPTAEFGTTLIPLPSSPSSQNGPKAGKGESAREQAEEGGMQELMKGTWECIDLLFFGGDGTPGAADMLSDTQWESRAGTDVGRPVCCGLFWLPQWRIFCSARCPFAGRGWDQLATGQSCIDAVPSLARLLRLSHIVIALLETGIESGAELYLADERAVKALGANGLAHHVAKSVESLAALLEPPQATCGCCCRRPFRCCFRGRPAADAKKPEVDLEAGGPDASSSASTSSAATDDGSSESIAAAGAADCSAAAAACASSQGRDGASSERSARASLGAAGQHLVAAEADLHLLLEGVAERREQVGGLVSGSRVGGLRVAAVLFIIHEILAMLGKARESLAMKRSYLSVEVEAMPAPEASRVGGNEDGSGEDSDSSGPEDLGDSRWRL